MSKSHSNRAGQREKVNLPPPATLRWGVRRKAAVVIGIRKGLITREDACKRYLLSTEELASWEADFAEYGRTGLLLKTLQQHRRARTPKSHKGARR
jgi:hypothetical protein